MSISLKESERRVISLQKAQNRERQFFAGRLKDLTYNYEELPVENTELKTRLKRIETRPGNHARARRHGRNSSTSSAVPSRKPSVFMNQVLSSNFTKPGEKSERSTRDRLFFSSSKKPLRKKNSKNSESSKKKLLWWLWLISSPWVTVS